jgi:hypothetical protein
MQSARIFRNEKSLGVLRLGRLPTLPELGQAFYRVVTINDKKKLVMDGIPKNQCLNKEGLAP